METFVWVDSWQEQCCGSGFAVGSEVRWSVLQDAEGHEFVEHILGTAWGQRVGYAEEHHGDDVDGVLSGIVSEINVVTCGYAPIDNPGGPPGRLLGPVEGSGQLRRVELADDWEPERGLPENRSFNGWIVRLDSAAFEPAQQP